MTYKIEVTLLNEAGYNEALHGLAKNRKQDDNKMPAVATRLADKDYGHNKFMRSIYLWFDVNAPRYWWQEMDTYQFQSDLFFECTKQSESTMNNLLKELLPSKDVVDDDEFFDNITKWCNKNLESPAADLRNSIGQACVDVLTYLNAGTFTYGSPAMILYLKQRIPESLMQSRSVCLNYQSLRNMMIQRHRHRLPHWRSMFEQLLSQIEHPELLPKLSNRSESNE